MAYSLAERQALLRIARASVRCAASGTPYSPSPDPDTPSEPAAVFVTLRTAEGHLRGCIGTVEALEPVADAVASMARSAALHDPRFRRVRPDEVADLAIQISVLTPAEPIAGPDDIRIGQDGLIVERPPHRGLLLPQVAAEWGWGPDTFLEQTCLKAGLPIGAWRDPNTRLLRFGAEVFGESDAG